MYVAGLGALALDQTVGPGSATEGTARERFNASYDFTFLPNIVWGNEERITRGSGDSEGPETMVTSDSSDADYLSIRTLINGTNVVSERGRSDARVADARRPGP